MVWGGRQKVDDQKLIGSMLADVVVVLKASQQTRLSLNSKFPFVREKTELKC